MTKVVRIVTTSPGRPSKPRAAGVLLAALLAAGSGLAAGETVTLTADRDNTLFQDAAGSLSNGAGPVMFAGRNSQGLARRALVRFDLSALPPDAVVSQATLSLNLSNVSDPTPRLFVLHRVQRDWGEGTSTGTGGSGAAATSGDATWLHTFFPGTTWASPGGDFDAVVSASQTVEDLGVYTWSGSQMIADVRAWLRDPAVNHGWLLVGDETALTTARRFDSRENPAAANRPTLTITYGTPTAVPIPRPGAGAWLEPCHPNPGTGPVTFAFVIPTAAQVELVVSDVTGRRLTTLVDRVMSAGRHELAWWTGVDGRRLPSGLYLYRLTVAARHVGTRRVVLVR